MTGLNPHENCFFFFCSASDHIFSLSLQGDVGEKGPEGAAGKDGARVRDFPFLFI